MNLTINDFSFYSKVHIPDINYMIMLEIMAHWEKLQARVVIHTLNRKPFGTVPWDPTWRGWRVLKNFITAANAGQSLEYVDPFLP